MRMSREIKFRAWGGDYFKMCEVLVIAFDTKDVYIKYFGEALQDHIEEYVPLAKLELMQYTGIKDDNGVDIFHRDLVKFNDRTIIYEVIWDEYRVAWWLKDVKADKRERDSDTDSQQLLNNSWQQRVVIGNIYENPELLEGKK